MVFLKGHISMCKYIFDLSYLIVYKDAIEQRKRGIILLSQEYSDTECGEVQCGAAEIGRIVNRPRSTIQTIIHIYCERKTFKDKPRVGRPKKLTEHLRPIIARKVKENPRTSYQGRVAQDILPPHYLTGIESYLLIKVNLKFLATNGILRYREKKGIAFNNENLQPTVKYGRGSVLVWGFMSASGVGLLHFIDGIMNQMVYIHILKTHLLQSATKMGIKDNYIFSQDNDPKHTAIKTRLWILYNTPKYLKTPPQSPDINPIEQLWSYLEKKLETTQSNQGRD
ncbi:uncharacterized protein [Euwallacea fornicatus]|uniref:uncharacterized protein n=1 Tax=Euwallacea fornicatus TaxID=995702 RepID=UPI0033901373